MSKAGPPSSTSSRPLSRTSRLARSPSVRADLAQSEQMTAEQRNRAVNAMAALLAAEAEPTAEVNEPTAP